jgi:hypothetical protein
MNRNLCSRRVNLCVLSETLLFTHECLVKNRFNLIIYFSTYNICLYKSLADSSIYLHKINSEFTKYSLYLKIITEHPRILYTPIVQCIWDLNFHLIALLSR